MESLKSIKVGIFAIISLAGLAYMSTRISNKGGFFNSHIKYQTFLNDADGIFERSKIRVAGINAGYIESIELIDDRALITFKVKDTIKVTSRTSLKVKTVGFLGEKFLDLKSTGSQGESLPPGTRIPTVEGSGIDQITESAGDTLQGVNVIVTKLKDAIVNDETNNALKDIVINMKEALESVNKIASQNSEALHRMIDNMEVITKGLSREFDQTNEEALINKTDEIGDIINNLKVTTENLNGVIGGLNRGEGSAGKILKDDTIHDSVADTLTNVNKLVRRINTIEADISMYSGKNITRKLEYTDVNLDLYPAPDKFYRFGITQSNYGPDGGTTKIKSSTVNGVTTVTEEREVNEYPLKLNIQIGKIFHRYAFRVGLIESTGGVGFDYLLSDYWGMKFSAEFFDFYGENGLNLRLMADFRIWNFLYARVAGEDLMNPTRGFSIGAGLKFTDEDLASLLGLAARAI